MSQNAKPASKSWTTDAICELVQNKSKKRACHFQIEVAQALYEEKDVVGCAPTGAGKTLPFCIPLLEFCRTNILFIEEMQVLFQFVSVQESYWGIWYSICIRKF